MSQKALVDTGDLSTAMKNTRLANATYVKQQRSLTNVLVASAPLDGTAAPSYIAQLAALGWQALRDVALPSARFPCCSCYCATPPCASTSIRRLTCLRQGMRRNRPNTSKPSCSGFSHGDLVPQRGTYLRVRYRGMARSAPTWMAQRKIRQAPRSPASGMLSHSCPTFLQPIWMRQRAKCSILPRIGSMPGLLRSPMLVWKVFARRIRREELCSALMDGWRMFVRSHKAPPPGLSRRRRSIRQPRRLFCVPALFTAMRHRAPLRSTCHRERFGWHCICWTASVRVSRWARCWDIAWNGRCTI